MRLSALSPLVGGLLVLVTAPTFAQSDECPYSRDLVLRIEMSQGTPLRLRAAAGSLELRGVQGLREARIRGLVCATQADLVHQASVDAEREGGAVVVETVMPDVHDRHAEDVFARIDLVVEVPAGSPATVHDASGSAKLSNLGNLEVHDASGDLEIEDINGHVEVHDGSGSLEVRRVIGRVEVHDGSGNVIIRDADGDVLVHDGSGSVDVDGVRGNLLVPADGSGSVRYANVNGRVDVPRRSRGRYR